jgi:hypothetical protein
MNTEDDEAIPIGCADDDPQHLVGQQAAAARSRDCLKAIAVRLKRISEAPRPCDHDNIGANPYLCPTLEVEGGLLSVTIDGLLSRVEQHANEVARRIKAGERGDENLIDRAVTLQAAIRRTEKRVQLLDEDLRYGVWGVPGASCSAVKCAEQDRSMPGGTLPPLQEFSRLGEVSNASSSWKGRIQRADTSLMQLTRGFLPCRKPLSDPYDTNTFCNRLEVEIPLLRESLERLKAEQLALELELSKRRALGQDRIERDFQLRLDNFQNMLRRTDTVIMIYFDSSVMD